MSRSESTLLILGAATHVAILALIVGSAFLPSVPLDWQALVALIALEAALLRIDVQNPFGGGG